MLNFVKNLNWFLICFLACAARGVILGFNYPVALTLVGFLALEAVKHGLRVKEENELEAKLASMLKGAEDKLSSVDDVVDRLKSLESKLALMNSTRRTM